MDTAGHVKATLPHVESNAVLVSPKLSKDGKPLWAAGPQVGYWSPQIFSEYELHGGGIDVEGVTFPGAAPWPLIGHGIDFAWTGTSANGDNQDTFVETLCSPDGSPTRQAASQPRHAPSAKQQAITACYSRPPKHTSPRHFLRSRFAPLALARRHRR